ncbi:hypothetical protein CHARACLAT_003214 [Characodon lateralis]|uniref:Fork-head domain-containing protein n=1 Tax=Characodon lateralis TaxID=208331 RepID=A0ABU7EZT8_9TELE|nr:hypothetical protein [Characodon lateralis]
MVDKVFFQALFTQSKTLTNKSMSYSPVSPGSHRRRYADVLSRRSPDLIPSLPCQFPHLGCFQPVITPTVTTSSSLFPLFPPAQPAVTMTSELESSLTSMDWLPQLTMQAAIHKTAAQNAHGPGMGKKSTLLDHNTTLDQEEVQQHKDGKPPYSYASLITFAINSSQKKKMTLSEIYQWICDNFPYYKEAGSGWKEAPAWPPAHQPHLAPTHRHPTAHALALRVGGESKLAGLGMDRFWQELLSPHCAE